MSISLEDFRSTVGDQGENMKKETIETKIQVTPIMEFDSSLSASGGKANKTYKSHLNKWALSFDDFLIFRAVFTASLDKDATKARISNLYDRMAKVANYDPGTNDRVRMRINRELDKNKELYRKIIRKEGKPIYQLTGLGLIFLIRLAYADLHEIYRHPIKTQALSEIESALSEVSMSADAGLKKAKEQIEDILGKNSVELLKNWASPKKLVEKASEYFRFLNNSWSQCFSIIDKSSPALVEVILQQSSPTLRDIARLSQSDIGKSDIFAPAGWYGYFIGGDIALGKKAIQIQAYLAECIFKFYQGTEGAVDSPTTSN